MASADHIPGSEDSGAWPLEICPQAAVTEQHGGGGGGGSGPRSLKGLEKDEVPCTEEQSRGGTPLGAVTHTAPQLRREAEAGRGGGRGPWLEDMEAGRHQARSPGSGGAEAGAPERPHPSSLPRAETLEPLRG